MIKFQPGQEYKVRCRDTGEIAPVKVTERAGKALTLEDGRKVTVEVCRSAYKSYEFFHLGVSSYPPIVCANRKNPVNS